VAAAWYGSNLRALAVHLLVFQHVPVARTQTLIANLTGARPSTGASRTRSMKTRLDLADFVGVSFASRSVGVTITRYLDRGTWAGTRRTRRSAADSDQGGGVCP
jgi:hypothetical protein